MDVFCLSLIISFFVYFLAAQVQFTSHRVTLSSKDLLSSVNSILTALNLPTVEKPKQSKQADQYGINFKVIEIEKFYDFTKIPKVSIK